MNKTRNILNEDTALTLKTKQVQQLKATVIDLYHKLDKGKVWSANADEICDMAEEYFIKKIDEIFPECLIDLYGKQNSK